MALKSGEDGGCFDKVPKIIGSKYSDHHHFRHHHLRHDQGVVIHGHRAKEFPVAALQSPQAGFVARAPMWSQATGATPGCSQASSACRRRLALLRVREGR